MDNIERGLSTEQANESLGKFGNNEIPSKKRDGFKKLIGKVISPINLMLGVAAVISYLSGKTFDYYFIIGLAFVNFSVSFLQEFKADKAIKELNDNFDTLSEVLRDGSWQKVVSKFLVPGDIVRLKTGDIVPADGIVQKTENASLNESALTGESLPVEKKIGDEVRFGAFMATGIAEILVAKTGKDTYFGKILFSQEARRERSSLEKDILSISKFLSFLSLIAVAVLSFYFLLNRAPIHELIVLDLSLVIAGIPIALPTVMTLIIETGILELAKKKAVVRRVSSLEDLANVDLLLSDKTGTLTQNKISVQEVLSFNGYSKEDVIRWAAMSIGEDREDAINSAIQQKAGEIDDSFKLVSFIPVDSLRKRSTATVQIGESTKTISVGAPQSVIPLTSDSMNIESDVAGLASKGYRSIAVALADGSAEKKMTLVGLIALSDALNSDSKESVEFMRDNGIGVKLVTGDNIAISREIAGSLGLNGKVIGRSSINNLADDEFEAASVFAEVLPEDKMALVRKAKVLHTVAVTGDGMNDLPPIKEANVGIAVSNAVDALRASADIVLLAKGISVIKDAIIESRKIFGRLYSYSIYRMSESLRLIITIAVLGLIYGIYPLTPLQLLLLAVLNDLPIISLAYDRVKIANSPNKIDAYKRAKTSVLLGSVGVANSLIMFFLLTKVFRVAPGVLQTLFFLKLTVGGHLLIYVARTRERWFKYLPSGTVMVVTIGTQLIATVLAVTGLFMPAGVSIGWAAAIWAWSLVWMQISDAIKSFGDNEDPNLKPVAVAA